MRVHPAAFDEAWAALTSASGRALEGTVGLQVEIADLRDEIISFELVGPKSGRVLKGAFKPDESSVQRQEFDEVR